MRMEKLRIAMVGIGDIAKKAYLPVMTSREGISPIICTRNKETLESLKNSYRIEEAFNDFDCLIKSRPHGIMIHSNTDTHFGLAKKSLKAGIATFIDKPLSLNITECEQLASLAKEKDTPLFVGFNRRYAPLLEQLIHKDKLHVKWQKNRVSLTSDAYDFIFNDFIHVLDGLVTQSSIREIPTCLNVFSHRIDGKLAIVTIRFSHRGTLYEGQMNRINGVTEEVVECYLKDEKYVIKNLTQGQHFVKGKANSLRFSDWQSYLETRGFNAMIDDWVSKVRLNSVDVEQLNSMLLSHQICESIASKVE